MSESALSKAQAYNDEAENMRAMALGVDDKHRRKIMLEIAEHYFLLHDKFRELHQLIPGEVVPFKR